MVWVDIAGALKSVREAASLDFPSSLCFLLADSSRRPEDNRAWVGKASGVRCRERVEERTVSLSLVTHR